DAGVRVRGGSLSVSGSEIDHQDAGVRVESGSASVTGSSVHDNLSYGISADAGTLSVTGTSLDANALAAANVSAAVSLTHSGNSATGGASAGFLVSGTLAASALWNADLPYVVSGAVAVPAGATLTVGPGAVVKSRTGGYHGLNVSGTLDVNGTPEAPVYFTSLKDDSAGGDTNGDGAATSPAPGDWNAVVAKSGSSVSIDGAVVRYGGYSVYSGDPRACLLAEAGGSLSLSGSRVTACKTGSGYVADAGVRVRGGSLSVSGSEIDHQDAGVRVESGSASVTGSSVHDNAYAIRNAGSTVVEAQNNWWGGGGLCLDTIVPPCSGQKVSANVTYSPWLDYDPIVPETAISFAPTGFVKTGDASVSFRSIFGRSFQCRLDGGSWEACQSPKTYSGLAEGQHSFEVYAIGPFGNADLSPASASWTIDTMVSSLAVITPQEGGRTATTTVNVSGTADDGVGSGIASVSVNGSDCAIAGSQWACPGVELEDGENTLHVMARDNSGNEATVDTRVTLRHPVVIVPGIMGSWNWNVMLHDSLPDSWSFSPGNEYYDGLIGTFEEAGYEMDTDLFVAFYDWRKSNDVNQAGNSVDSYLIPMIDRAKAACNCGQVDVVAHSMGGLLSRSYIESDRYVGREDVHQLVLVAVPNQGSSTSYGLWEGGRIPKSWDAKTKSFMAGYLWSLSDNKLFGLTDEGRYLTIHSNVNSVQEFLPTYDYVVRDGETVPSASLIERNQLLPSMNSNLSTLLSRAHVHTIIGTGEPTVDSIPVVTRSEDDAPLWVDGRPDPIDPVANSLLGDGTVLRASATIEGVDSETVIPATHTGILDSSEPVVARILGALPQTYVPSPSYADFISYWFASPVSVRITDPQGRVITSDSNGIPGAEYSGESDPAGVKVVFIPDPLPGQYHVELTGVAEGGEYHMAVSSGGSEGLSVVGGNIQPGQVLAYDANFDPTNPDEPVTVVDASPPVVGEVSPLSAPMGETVTLSAAYSDDTGVTACTLLVDGDEQGIMSLSAPSGVTGIATLAHSFAVYGGHDVFVRCADAAGNVGDGPTITFQATDAASPSVAIVFPAEDLLTKQPTIAVFGTASDAESGLAAVSVNGTACGISGNDWSCPAVPLSAEGSNALTATATDLAGNSAIASVSVTLDTVPPDSVIDSGPAELVSSADATVAFHATEDGVAFACSLDGAVFSTCASPASLAGLADGPHSFAVRATDAAGNDDPTPATIEWTVDTVAPAVAISAPNDGLLTNQPTVTVSGTASDSGSGLASVSVNGANCENVEGAWMCADLPLVEGANALTATATDAAGNPATAIVTVTLDTIAPDTTIDSGPAATTTETSAAFAFAATEEGSVFSCSLDGVTAEPCASPKEYSGLALGAHSFSVYASDPAGNPDTTLATWAWTVVSPDADGDGVLDADDDCPAVPGAPERNGCPFADRTNVDMRIIDSAKTGECGYRPDGKPIVECTRPLAGVTVKVFDRDDADFISAFGGRRPAKHLMDDVYESGVGLVGACVTDAAGTCLAGEDHPGRFLVVVKHTEGAQSVYTGKLKEFRKSVRNAFDAEDDDDDVFEDVNPNWLMLTKNLHIIKHIKKNGEVKLDGGKLTVVTGSRLDVLQPDYVVWSGEEELYPFVLTADDNDWTVDACLEVPAGYEIAGVLDENGDVVTTESCVSTVLRNESKVFLFRAVDVGSPEPDFGLTLTASHPGKAPTRVNATLEGMRSRMEAGIEKGVRTRVSKLAPKWSAKAAEVGEKARSVADKKAREANRR
ncbi:MAG: hypothetical protein PHT12_01330, partial [Patescibacteria group bacterium]|nr:hypothetical protein [Patescibacteria group bacterium]